MRRVRSKTFGFRRVTLLMALGVLFSFSPLSRPGPAFAGGADKDAQMELIIVPVGSIDTGVLEALKDALARVFNKDVTIGPAMPEPEYAFNESRRQYLSTAILDRIALVKEYGSYERALGVVDHDLYVPELNFVFGEASPRIAVISLTRLRQEYYGLPKDTAVFRTRMLTEAIHELGHTYGLGHCGDPHCVMFFSNSLLDTDRKGTEFCPRCKRALGMKEG